MSRRSIWVDLLMLVAFFALIWVAFMFIPSPFSKPDVEISIENEEKLGKVITEDLLLKHPDYKEIHTPQADSALAFIEERLLDNIGLTDYEYHIRIVNNPEINAVTLPGGNILIFKGLMTFAESPEELAAVLAHEIGHVENRHSTDKLIKEFGIAVIFSVITGGDHSLVSEISHTMLSTAFDRGQERIADDYALQLLEKSAISPRSLASFFRRLKKEKGDYNKNLQLLMTHPHTNSRIKSSIQYQLPENFKAVEFDLDWERVRSSLRESTL